MTRTYPWECDKDIDSAVRFLAVKQQWAGAGGSLLRFAHYVREHRDVGYFLVMPKLGSITCRSRGIFVQRGNTPGNYVPWSDVFLAIEYGAVEQQLF